MYSFADMLGLFQKGSCGLRVLAKCFVQMSESPPSVFSRGRSVQGVPLGVVRARRACKTSFLLSAALLQMGPHRVSPLLCHIGSVISQVYRGGERAL